MKTIELTKGLVALVDDEDYDFLSQWKWYAKTNKKTGKSYACRSVHTAGQQPKAVVIHRTIMQAKPGEIVDHKDGNPLNNQRSNLRICNHQQNTCNSPSRSGTSKYKGVHKQGGKWAAVILANGVSHRLGSYYNEGNAARAYNEAAARLHGEFAYLNVVDEKDLGDESKRPLVFTEQHKRLIGEANKRRKGMVLKKSCSVTYQDIEPFLKDGKSVHFISKALGCSRRVIYSRIKSQEPCSNFYASYQ